MTKISIIMPCFNVAHYIERAVNSVLIQDFRDWELIIVNDGSSDNLLEVCEQWADDPRIHVLSTINQGLSQARNEGIEIAQGEYVYFFDPDDYINPSMFRELIEKCCEGNYDAVHFGFRKIFEDQGGAQYDKAEKPYVYSSNKEIIEKYLPKFIGFGQEHVDHWKDGYVWNKVEFSGVWRFFFKRSVLMKHNVRFRKGIIVFEDRLFVSLFFLYANSIAIMDGIYYNYFVRNNGLLLASLNNHDRMVQNKINGVIERGHIRQQYLKEKDFDIFNFYNGTLVLGALELIVKGTELPIKDNLNGVRKYLVLKDVQYAFKITDTKGFPLKIKLPVMMIKMGLVLPLILLLTILKKIGINMTA